MRTMPRNYLTHSPRNSPLYLLFFDVCYEGVEPELIKFNIRDPLISGLNETQSAAIRNYHSRHPEETMVDPDKSFELFRLGLLGIGI